jgi:hypothetical protein
MSPKRSRRPRMTPDAYAGFIRLLLTPLSQDPLPSSELDAYLRYLRDAERFEGGDQGRGRAA